jgi:NADPH-dependent 2,4-dienoyl-CoA reductase/sulfur reductase-like enzyme
MPATPISSDLAPLVVAGGSLATGREVARQAGAAGREVRVVDEPASCGPPSTEPPPWSSSRRALSRR